MNIDFQPSPVFLTLTQTMQNSIIGHQQILEQLHHAMQSDRVAGAYLFVGPANVGKETVALYFTKSINCVESEDGACGQCLSCRKTDNGNHPDVQIIRPSGARLKIDQIRELQKRIVYRALESKRKVYILTEVERMNLEAANCLLKTLEEPPAASILILLTTNLEALLLTIRSRCQVVQFYPLPVRELATHLMAQFNLEETQAFSVANLSGGAVGKALTLLEGPSHAEHGNEPSFEEEIPEILTATDRLAVFRIAEQFSQNPEGLDGLVTWYRDLLLLHQDAPSELLTHIYHADTLKQLVPRYSRLHLQSAIKTIFEAKNLLQRNVNATLALEVMMLKLLGNQNKSEGDRSNGRN
ncbi:DNA polymerase III subunit delta' [Candidatus Poribacteria bacterium]|nr:DNA polymerase III subunit delta' [Candidatus Poribacteria bacterium]